MLLLSFTCNSQNGYIQIISEPDISVFLDGIFKGKTKAEIGGIIIEDVTPGKHIIRAFKEDYEAQDSIVKVISGEVLTIKLKPLINKATVEENVSVLYDCKTGEHVDRVKKNDLKRLQKQFNEAIVFRGTDATEEELVEVNSLLYEKGLYFDIVITSKQVLSSICLKYDIEFEGDNAIEKIYSYYIKTTSHQPAPYSHLSKTKYYYHSFFKLQSPLKSSFTVTFLSGKVITVKP